MFYLILFHLMYSCKLAFYGSLTFDFQTCFPLFLTHYHKPILPHAGLARSFCNADAPSGRLLVLHLATRAS